jgi:hypothetical protein
MRSYVQVKTAVDVLQPRIMGEDHAHGPALLDRIAGGIPYSVSLLACSPLDGQLVRVLGAFR